MIGKSRSIEGTPAGSFPHAGTLGAGFSGLVIQRLLSTGFARWVGVIKPQAVVLRIVFEDFGVPAPVQRRINLLLRFFLGNIFVEDVVEKFDRHGVIRFTLKRGL